MAQVLVPPQYFLAWVRESAKSRSFTASRTRQTAAGRKKARHFGPLRESLKAGGMTGGSPFRRTAQHGAGRHGAVLRLCRALWCGLAGGGAEEGAKHTARSGVSLASATLSAQ